MITNKILLAVLTIVITAFYFFWNPSEITFSPICPFKQITGYYCPGCGGQRAFHQILHGNFVEAFHNNFLIFIFLPFLVLKIKDEFNNTTFSAFYLLIKNLIWIFFSFILCFTIARNLPFYPFNLLIHSK
ncbi:MAG: DUF2752 domain-containing protein [Arcicella sp.]|nr:DUF2752 domain-containing protein [Arcicella sp.]